MLRQLKINNKKVSGFTLIEITVALAISGVLMAYAIPSYYDFSKRQALSNETNNLLADLNFARSLAIENGSTVTVTSIGAGVNWSNGWRIRETIAGGTLVVVREQIALPNNVNVIASSSTVSYNLIGGLVVPTTINFNVQITPDYPNFLSVSVQPSGMASSNRGL